jgi:hypothetical protein
LSQNAAGGATLQSKGQKERRFSFNEEAPLFHPPPNAPGFSTG